MSFSSSLSATLRPYTSFTIISPKGRPVAASIDTKSTNHQYTRRHARRRYCYSPLSWRSAQADSLSARSFYVGHHRPGIKLYDSHIRIKYTRTSLVPPPMVEPVRYKRRCLCYPLSTMCRESTVMGVRVVIWHRLGGRRIGIPLCGWLFLLRGGEGYRVLGVMVVA